MVAGPDHADDFEKEEGVVGWTDACQLSFRINRHVGGGATWGHDSMSSTLDAFIFAQFEMLLPGYVKFGGIFPSRYSRLRVQ
jgi:hypothetical protein